jgi:hypothetical protein
MCKRLPSLPPSTAPLFLFRPATYMQRGHLLSLQVNSTCVTSKCCSPLPSNNRDPIAKASAVPQSKPTPRLHISRHRRKNVSIWRWIFMVSGIVPETIPIRCKVSMFTPIGRIQLICSGLLNPFQYAVILGTNTTFCQQGQSLPQ